MRLRKEEGDANGGGHPRYICAVLIDDILTPDIESDAPLLGEINCHAAADIPSAVIIVGGSYRDRRIIGQRRGAAAHMRPVESTAADGVRIDLIAHNGKSRAHPDFRAEMQNFGMHVG